MGDTEKSKLAVRRPPAIAVAFCIGVSAMVLAALILAAVAHDFRILRTSTVGQPYPMPIYTLMAARGTSPVRGAPGASGADFSQVYTSALALRHGESAYRPKSREFADRFNRPPGYPPLMNLLFVPVSFLSYYDAFLFHVVGSVVAFLGASWLLLRKLEFARLFKWIALATTTLYFLTPIGLTHLERGQFDLVTATSYVIAFGCLYLPGKRFGWATMSGLVGALKWTAVPFLGCFSALGFVLDSGIRRWHFALIP
ncbi:MAG TPA: glycosyltransferase family 87 protein, partial [Polyangiaceae bacterium]|nr:glycosyltransferase family 87 protein [Polyangiaceae bacterium]